MPERKPPAYEPAPSPPAPTAGASSDPDVHVLIANRRAHEMVLAAEDSTPANREHAEQSIADIDRQLRERGFR
jgi:hypothetical protein